MQLFFGDLIDLPKGQTIESDVKAVVELFNNENFPNLYKTEIHNIADEFKIVPESRDDLESLLTHLSVLYLIFIILPHSGPAFETYFKQLSEITRMAKKLRNLLNNAGNDFADFLSLLEVADPKKAGDIAPRQFFYDLVESLNLLIAAPMQISKTNVGKAYRIGAKGRKPNEALYAWISCLLEFWKNNLGRSLQRDATQLGGRKQFLEFIDRCIEPLHPDIMLHNSDALDTMLKSVQRDNKRGENKAIF